MSLVPFTSDDVTWNRFDKYSGARQVNNGKEITETIGFQFTHKDLIQMTHALLYHDFYHPSRSEE